MLCYFIIIFVFFLGKCWLMIILAIFKVLITTHYDTSNVMCKKKYFLTLSLCLFLTNIMWSLYLMSQLSVNLKCVMLFFLLFFFWWKCLLIIKSLDYHILLYIECLVKKYLLSLIWTCHYDTKHKIWECIDQFLVLWQLEKTSIFCISKRDVCKLWS